MSLAETQILNRWDSYRFGNGPKLSLQPGTMGWSIEDLSDPAVRFLWEEGRYEILDGVLTIMPPAYFRGGKVVDNLKFLLRSYFRAANVRASFSGEVDVAFAPDRVIRADGVVVSGDDLPKFESLTFDPPHTDWQDHELILPPTIIIESVSKGHEAHDRVTKRKWYAEFKVPHYWIVDGFARTLECLRLENEQYILDAMGKQNEILQPSGFSGLTIPLQDVWET
jgi:Uma2 family endonuclease